MKTAQYFKHVLEFKRPGGTSRGVLNTKETYLLEVFENGKKGMGECGIFRGLSYDDVPEYEEKMKWLCENINLDKEILKKELQHFPSIWFGYEQAILNLKNSGNLYFPSDFTKGKAAIKINGLIWMGNVDFMQEQIQEKLELGFDCIKLKIGVNWSSEKEVLKKLREKFPAEKLEIRVDANGAFTFEEAKIVLEELAALKVHSIEQPIKKMEVRSPKTEELLLDRDSADCFVSRNDMANLCADTPTAIALDEELIGVISIEDKKRLLETIKPQYIILKPSLVGGFSGCDEWISLAESLGIAWWITSALESNIGLNAIAQYTYTKKNPMPQGLGTGSLFTNNFESNLELIGDQMWYRNPIDVKPM